MELTLDIPLWAPGRRRLHLFRGRLGWRKAWLPHRLTAAFLVFQKEPGYESWVLFGALYGPDYSSFHGGEVVVWLLGWSWRRKLDALT